MNLRWLRKVVFSFCYFFSKRERHHIKNTTFGEFQYCILIVLQICVVYMIDFFLNLVSRLDEFIMDFVAWMCSRVRNVIFWLFRNLNFLNWWWNDKRGVKLWFFDFFDRFFVKRFFRVLILQEIMWNCEGLIM